MQEVYNQGFDDGLKAGKESHQWRPISEVPDIYKQGHRMLVVKAVDVEGFGSMPYTSDPYCVWLERYDLGYGPCGRWPHQFPPTHFCELPD